MSDSDKELDEVNFSDQAFDNLIKPTHSRANVHGASKGPGKRDAESITAINATTFAQAYRDGATTMDVQKSEVAI